MQITSPERAETPALLELIAAYHAHDGIQTSDVRRRAALEGLLDAPELGRVWVAREGEALLGYVALTFDYSLEFGGREGFIDELFVAASARGRGVGRALLEHATRVARELALGGLNIVVEQRNDAALAFYERCGWSKPHRVVLYRDFGSDPVD